MKFKSKFKIYNIMEHEENSYSKVIFKNYGELIRRLNC